MLYLLTSSIVLLLSFVFSSCRFYRMWPLLTFCLITLKQILMIVQVIPVRTTGPEQTEWTDSTAAAHLDLMERNVKQVIETDNLINLIVRVNNKTAKLTKIGSQSKGVFPRNIQPLEKGKKTESRLWLLLWPRANQKINLFYELLWNFHLIYSSSRNVLIPSLEHISL